MKAKLKTYFCSDIENLEAFQPEDPASFCLVLQLGIGPIDGPGYDNFQLTVCTPKWLEQQHTYNGYSRHLWLTPNYDFPTIIAGIQEYISQIGGESWAEIATQLAQFAYWEFEGYQP